MKILKMKQTVALILGFLGIAKLPIENGALAFTEEQTVALEKALGEKLSVEKVVTAINKELSDMQDDAAENDQVLIDARAEIEKELLAHGLSQEDLAEGAETPEGVDESAIEGIQKMVSAYVKKTDAKLKKLMDLAEDDIPETKGTQQKNKDMRHSATHLFASNNQLDAFESRPWNKVAAGHTAEVPTFALGSVEVETLQGDFDLYNREVDANVKSLIRNFRGLPSWWRVITNVDDKVANGKISTAEITQARKKGYLPKNVQSIQPEENQIFPVQVDMEFSGHELQRLLTSWLAQYNKEGSQAYKWSFVRFLIEDIDKRARLEDRIAAVKGIYVPTPDGATIAGLAKNRADGLLIKLYRAFYYANKFVIAHVAAPTKSNILDHVKEVIVANIPEEERSSKSLVYYLSHDWMVAYAERKRQIFGLDTKYTEDQLYEVENYPNIKLAPLADLARSDFHFITYDDNISILENIPKEKSLYRFEASKRDMFVFGDYKFGVGIDHIGRKLKSGDPAAFKVQTVWTNGQPFFPADEYTRLYDDTTGEVALPYSNITITDDWATNLDTITNTYEGQIVRIRGNQSATGNVTDDGNITLAGNADFDLATGGTLTLRAAAGNVLTEVKRDETAPVLPDADVDFNGTVVDADTGNTFNYTGVAATLTAITGGIEGQEIVINGGAATLTIDDVAGNIEVASTAALLNAADNLTLTLIDGVWTEVARTI